MLILFWFVITGLNRLIFFTVQRNPLILLSYTGFNGFVQQTLLVFGAQQFQAMFLREPYNQNGVSIEVSNILLSKKSESKFCIWDALRNLIPFVQFKKREKDPWLSVTFECYRLEPATLLKVTLLHGCFLRFINCTNGSKLRKASPIIKLWHFFVHYCDFTCT